LHTLDADEQKQLKRLVEKHGLAGAARLLDVSRGVVASAAGGLGVRRGSIELLRNALKNQVSE
jgi:hypothetical protein